MEQSRVGKYIEFELFLNFVKCFQVTPCRCKNGTKCVYKCEQRNIFIFGGKGRIEGLTNFAQGRPTVDFATRVVAEQIKTGHLFPRTRPKQIRQFITAKISPPSYLERRMEKKKLEFLFFPPP